MELRKQPIMFGFATWSTTAAVGRHRECDKGENKEYCERKRNKTTIFSSRQEFESLSLVYE